MGSYSRKASDRAIIRQVLPNEERETLLPCPACQGNCRTLTETPDGRYKMKLCRWCQGFGCVDKLVFKLFKRWLRIYNHNRLAGRCELPK